ncbi:MAG: hypothetical protein R3C97_06480 [Geminicoccaceae bacterium]
MDGSAALILYLVLFIGVLLAFDGLMQVLVGHRQNDDEAINRRLLLASGADPEGSSMAPTTREDMARQDTDPAWVRG